MGLPAFATLEEFAVRLPAGLDEPDDPRAQAALDDASALIRAEAGKTWTTDGELDDDVPGIILSVCMAAARRAFNNPDGIRSESTGSYSASFADSSSDVYLTKAEVKHIRRAAGRTGVWSLPTTRSSSGLDDVYLDVTPSGEPMPYLPADGPT